MRAVALGGNVLRVVLTTLLASVFLCGTAAALARTPSPDTANFSPSRIVDNQKRVCVYDDNSVKRLAQFAAVAGRRTVDCGMVYTGSPNWSGWDDPWFLGGSSDLDWASWVRRSPANDRRQLIISQPLIPSGLAGSDWLSRGAHGDFRRYAKRLARNLIAAGVPDALIRLSWEMNGNWNIDSIPDTVKGDAEWVRFWRITALAMKSVPGAHFVFDWCPNNGYRAIALKDYYPGDDVVDVIGDDAYDGGVPASVKDKWEYIYGRADGLGAVIAFAKAHHKPLSLPEWGVGADQPKGSTGESNPAYVRHMATVVADNDVAFQSYFDRYGFARELAQEPRTRAAFRAAFGRAGYADGPDAGTDVIHGTPLHHASRRARHR